MLTVTHFIYLFPEEQGEIRKLQQHFNGNLAEIEDMTVLSVSFNLSGPQEILNTLVKLEKTREEAASLLAEALGETTLLVFPPDLVGELVNALRNIKERPYPAIAIKAGTLFAHLEDKQRHYYGLAATADHTEFAGTLPSIDLPVFKALFKLNFFQEQLHTIMTEKKAMDQTIGQVLHGQVVITGAEEEKIGFLENHIENLGRSFAALGSNYLVVKNMESVLEKQLAAINRAVRSLTGDGDIMDGPLAEVSRWIRKKADKCKNAAEDLALSRDNAKAAAEMVQTQVSLARTREEVALQNQMQSMLRQNVGLLKEGIALQVSAAFIEFIVVNYYSLSIWKTLTPEEVFHHIPAWLKLLAVFSFAATAVVSTHAVAEYFQHKNKKTSTRLILSGLAMFTVFAGMVAASLVY